jgi:hypothetical protein
MIRAALVFLAVVIVDIAWSKYIQRVSDGHRWQAASWASGLYALGAYVVTQYVDDTRMIVPAVLGAFVGTYLGSKR